MKRPKILLALFRFPYPATDGTRYKILHNVIEGLSKDFDLEFFIVSIDPYTPDQIAYLEEKYGKVHVFYHSRLAFLENAIPALWSGLPFQAQAFFFRDASEWLESHLSFYDAVYVHEIRLTEYFRNVSLEEKKKIVVDFNDAISLHYKQSLESINFLKKLFYRFEGNRVTRYESRVLKSFSFFNIVSEFDKAYLLRETKIEPKIFSVIHHGVVVSSQIVPLDKKNLFFMGNLDYEPNRDALLFFLKVLWPSIAAAIPDIHFFVAGKGKKIKIELPNVHFVGFVPDAFDVMSKCSLMVAPLRFGGGSPSKIIESMAYGLPVLTTPQGAAGIVGARNGENIYIVPETNTEEWIEIIKKNNEERELKNIISRNARQLVIEDYSMRASQEAFRKLFHSVFSSN